MASELKPDAAWRKRPAAGLTDAEAIDYSGRHLAYEAEMFLEAARDLFNTKHVRVGTPADRRTRNRTVEALFAHGRCLYDFLRAPLLDCDGKVVYFDAVHAVHFLDGWLARKSPAADRFKMRSNKELAHLTTNRRSSTEPSKQIAWDGPRDIWCELRRFAEAAPPTRLHERVRTITAEDLLPELPCGSEAQMPPPVFSTVDSTAEVWELDTDTVLVRPETMALVLGLMERERGGEEAPLNHKFWTYRMFVHYRAETG